MSDAEETRVLPVADMPTPSMLPSTVEATQVLPVAHEPQRAPEQLAGTVLVSTLDPAALDPAVPEFDATVTHLDGFPELGKPKAKAKAATS